MKKAEKLGKIFDFLQISENLKKTYRWKNTEAMKHKESSADHSWHLSLMAVMVMQELKLDVDQAKVLKIAIIHDLVEAITDDFDNVLIHHFKTMTREEKQVKEETAMLEMEKILPSSSSKEISEIWHEYEETKTPEAKLVRALDRMESINHMLHETHECFDLPDYVAPWPNESVRDFPALKPLLQELQKRLKPEYKKHGWKWKKEYEI